MAIDHCHFGMQMTRLVFVNFDPGIQQRAVQGARGGMLQAVFNHALQ